MEHKHKTGELVVSNHMPFENRRFLGCIIETGKDGNTNYYRIEWDDGKRSLVIEKDMKALKKNLEKLINDKT